MNEKTDVHILVWRATRHTMSTSFFFFFCFFFVGLFFAFFFFISTSTKRKNSTFSSSMFDNIYFPTWVSILCHFW